jgi:uncharacterized protein
MSARLPEFIDPWHFAEIGKEVSGQVRLQDLPRLAGILVDSGGEAEFKLRFHEGEKRRVHITGFVKAVLQLECQRCLESVHVPVTAEVDVTVVEGYEEALLLPDGQEPLLAGDKRIRLTEVIEDELLLALPQVPMHSVGECKVECGRFPGCSNDVSNVLQKEKPANPFAVLKDLKK